MAAKTLDLAGAKSANITVVEDEERGRQAVHDVIVAMRANRRSGTAHTKTRGEVAATGKKPYRQKGTGNARRGGNASPITRGGGVAFGPRNQKIWAKDVNKATKRLAFSKALSERINEGDVATLSDFAVSDGKTKTFAGEVSSLAPDAKRVLIIGDFTEETKRAGRNYQAALLMTPNEVNTEHLLHYSKIFVVEGALEVLAARTAK